MPKIGVSLRRRHSQQHYADAGPRPLFGAKDHEEGIGTVAHLLPVEPIHYVLTQALAPCGPAAPSEGSIKRFHVTEARITQACLVLVRCQQHQTGGDGGPRLLDLARYSVLDREFYLPELEHLASQATGNRQGRGNVLGKGEAEDVLRILTEDANRTYDHYTAMLNEPDQPGHDPDRAGLSRELARIGLSLSTYTQFYWKVDLHNLLGFLRLRADPHAQYEIRVYAEAMLDVVRRWVPTTYEAFLEYRLGSLSLSATATEMVRRALAGEMPTFETSGLNRREWDEVANRLGLA